MRRIFLISFLLTSAVCLAQRFADRSLPEKKWALFHPFAALKTKKLYACCRPLYLEVKRQGILDTIENGSKLDAFRHVFFMAAFAQKISARKVRKLGKAHEKGNYRAFKKGKKEDGEIPDSLSMVMDLHNNEVGIKLGRANKKMNLHSLRDLTLQELRSGHALYFKRRGYDFLDCKDNVIRPEEFSGKWFLPKCLIRSDY
jgi:hypothetical protein